MATDAIAMNSVDAPMERYRRIERALWDHYGLEPTERFIDLGSPSVRLRVLEIGSGEPLLFVHGTVGPGSWPVLVRELPGFRCVVIDRPGWGLSSAINFTKYEYKAVAADILRGALDALALDRAHVVGGSIGNVWALGLAARHPSRVGRVVLMGGSPLAPEIHVPGIIRLLASPIGAIMVRLPDRPERVRSILRQSGHGASLDDGRIPDVFVNSRVALGRETASMRNERDMVRTIVRGNAFRPGLTFDDAEFASIQTPALYVYGTADPVGTVDIWRRVVGLLPRGELKLLDGAGHMPWFDGPSQVAADVTRFLTESSEKSKAVFP
jgi:2-hydroxy-6-oxonona-2,4-dienedioate hydrolase